jgi:hypothetical protein
MSDDQRIQVFTEAHEAMAWLNGGAQRVLNRFGETQASGRIP